mmetsp:Transcript_25745/g.45406  ORF Transcript_25745/g.45406 Transcript_25745/m.45406 type:complete len:282 (-) Transcript_25745:42-887(-)
MINMEELLDFNDTERVKKNYQHNHQSSLTFNSSCSICTTTVDSTCDSVSVVSCTKRVTFSTSVEEFHYQKMTHARSSSVGNKTKKTKDKKKSKKKKKHKSTLWYSIDELVKIQKKNKRTIKLFLLGDLDTEGENPELQDKHCTRGLYTKREQRRSQRKYEESLKKVLVEQERQHQENIFDPERLAVLYARKSRKSQLEALHRGLQDAFASRGEEHHLIPHHDHDFISQQRITHLKRSSSARQLSRRASSNNARDDDPSPKRSLPRRWSSNMVASSGKKELL